MSKEKGMRFGSYELTKPVWKVREDVKDNDFSELVDYILTDKKAVTLMEELDVVRVI